MYADHPIDNELKTRESNPAMGQAGEREGPIGIGDIHHDFDRNVGQLVERDLGLFKVKLPGINKAFVAFGT